MDLVECGVWCFGLGSCWLLPSWRIVFRLGRNIPARPYWFHIPLALEWNLVARNRRRSFVDSFGHKRALNTSSSSNTSLSGGSTSEPIFSSLAHNHFDVSLRASLSNFSLYTLHHCHSFCFAFHSLCRSWKFLVCSVGFIFPERQRAHQRRVPVWRLCLSRRKLLTNAISCW